MTSHLIPPVNEAITKRGLALVLGQSAAHVTRPVEVAKVLRTQGHEVIFAGPGKYLEIAKIEGFETRSLPGLPTERMVEATQSGRIQQIYRFDELEQWVETERDLIQRIRPDYILADQRLTASTSAELAHLPMIAINNAHMTMYRQIPFVDLRRTFLKNWPSALALAERIENIFEFLFWELVITRPMNQVRKKLGLKCKYSYHIDEGVLNLIADVPEFNPLRNPPSHFHFVGPLTWKNNLPTPTCISQLKPQQKCVYLSLGSEGLTELLPQIGECFDSEIQVIVATGAEIPTHIKVPPNIFLEKFVNADKVLPHCDLVICHGGNGTIYQALSHGVPILGVATHDEQFYGLRRLQELGLGIALRKKQIQENGATLLKKMSQQILSNSSYREKAQSFQSQFLQQNGAQMAAKYILEYLNK